MTIGEQIKQVRKEKGLTQKQLGELSKTSEGTIRQYELGKRQPRIEQLRRIASALGVDAYSLMDFDQTTQAVEKSINTRFDALGRVNAALEQLNTEGMQKAADAVEVIAGNPLYTYLSDAELAEIAAEAALQDSKDE